MEEMKGNLVNKKVKGREFDVVHNPHKTIMDKPKVNEMKYDLELSNLINRFGDINLIDDNTFSFTWMCEYFLVLVQFPHGLVFLTKALIPLGRCL